ncbi:MAG: KEOPS complex subunit Pcc1 [Candidatus Bathyarchaeia archaeon]
MGCEVKGGAMAEINLSLSSEALARIILEALMPEIQRLPTKRSKVALKVEDDVLSLLVEAADVSALRASLNSYCWWILCLIRVLEEIEGGRHKSSV